jgi:hypothetical protein
MGRVSSKPELALKLVIAESRWEKVQAAVQQCAVSARASGNHERERAFLDVLILMERAER